MASHKFLVIIKPDGVERRLVGEITSRFEKKGFTLTETRMLQPHISRSYIPKHFASHANMQYYDETLNFMLSGPIVVMMWYGNIAVARKIVGDTTPWKAESGTVRGDYSCTLPQNLIHCSHDVESALAETSLWAPVFE